MCNRYAADIRKAGMERDYWGFDEWSETRINPSLGNAVLEVFPKSQALVIRNRWIDGKRTQELEWQTMCWGVAGPATVRRRAGHQHPQCEEPALAQRPGRPASMPCAVHGALSE
jgi:putative SOS response-associated peptidase YedK